MPEKSGVVLARGLVGEFLLEACGFQEAGELLLNPAGGREGERRSEAAKTRVAYFELQLCEWLSKLIGGRSRRLQSSAAGYGDMLGVPASLTMKSLPIIAAFASIAFLLPAFAEQPLDATTFARQIVSNHGGADKLLRIVKFPRRIIWAAT